MARYFFHVMNGKTSFDDVGIELPDMDSVRKEAIKSAGQMLSTGLQPWQGESWQMFVADAESTIVFSVRFSADRHGL